VPRVGLCHVIVFKFIGPLFPPAFGLRQCALPGSGTRGRKIEELCVPRVLGYIPKAPLTHESFIFTRDACAISPRQVNETADGIRFENHREARYFTLRYRARAKRLNDTGQLRALEEGARAAVSNAREGSLARPASVASVVIDSARRVTSSQHLAINRDGASIPISPRLVRKHQ